ncbi:MAG: sigma-70 family RNA polymerase sigma factor [Rhizobiales bacterium]|nr:sigma-70 family RNA polymerase sigma factor [Hyphomicrobiales bacterium]
MLAACLRRIADERDEAAFKELFDALGPRVKSLMMRQGADRDTAEDIAQDTLLTVWRKAHLFSEEKGSASTWIFTIARNIRIDRLRRQSHLQPISDDMPEEASDEPLADAIVGQNQENAIVGRVLEGLPEEQMAVIRLSFVDGLSHSEIASRLELPLGTVKSRMRLAYQKVRSAIEGEI